ncbi:MAG TPA: glycosyltransferase family 39 protein, partial [Candidatus Dormibacteraeota bacterium]
MGAPAFPGGEQLRARVAAIPRPRPELVGLLVLAAVLYLWGLDQNGWANEYYSAAVRSMSSSWHNFFYDSFDPSGVMTVDKPPLGLWVQALSVRVFGYHALSMLIPQALMGVASVALVYDLVRRRFGRTAGFVGGLALALTPMTVAISRHNNPDAMLILCCVAALWFVVRGLEDGRTRWLVVAGVSVGLAFEAKMAAALLIVPALVAAWMWVAPRGRVAALRQLLAGGAAMVVVGGAWPLFMALTPTADRPWISGTSDNSILSLIFDYNGLGRLDGQAGGPQAFGGGGGGGGGGGLFGGSSGPLRLLNDSFGGQAGWLLGLALVGGIAVLVATRLRRSDTRSGWLIATGGAFLTIGVALSTAKGIVHPYYIAQLAPFTAALVGAGAAQLLRGDRIARVLAPLAVVAAVAGELVVLDNNPGQLTWLVPVLVGAGLFTAAALAMVGGGRLRAAVLGAALATLLLAPASWAVDTLGHSTNGTFPAGGPSNAGIGQGPGGRGGPGGGLAGPSADRARRTGGPGYRAARRCRWRRWVPGRARGRASRRGWRRWCLRRRLGLPQPGRALRQPARRRDDRRLQPEGCGDPDHLERRRRGRDRRLLRAREPGQRQLAGGRGAVRPGPLGADERRVRKRSGPRRACWLQPGDGGRGGQLQAGDRADIDELRDDHRHGQPLRLPGSGLRAPRCGREVVHT